MKQKVFVVITAAGKSIRMGGIKKEFIPVNDRPLIEYAISTFDNLHFIDRIYVVFTPGEEDLFIQNIKKEYFKTPITLVKGGETRQQSVFNGLDAMKNENPDIVLIHDGSRPAVSERLIERVFKATSKHGAAAPVIPLVDSLKKTDENGFLVDHPDREEFKLIQTPQGFIYKDILAAHIKASKDNKEYHDDTEIFSRYIGRVSTVEGSKKNIKITYQEDIDFLKHKRHLNA